MASKPDWLYDVILREAYCSPGAVPAGCCASVADLNKGDLPLMLTRGGFSVGRSPAYGGTLSRGDGQDADSGLGQFTYRTQRDWSKGRGQEYSYEPTERYLDGICDTRFAGYLSNSLGGLAGTTSFVISARPMHYPSVNGLVYPSNTNVKYRAVPTAIDTWANLNTVALAANVVSMAVFGGELYCALGMANDMVKHAGTVPAAFTAIAGKKFKLIHSDNQYLYGISGFTPGTPPTIQYFNGAAWSSTINTHINGEVLAITDYRNELILSASDGLYSMTADIVYKIVDFSDRPSAYNGVAMRAWVDGNLYVGVLNGVVRYNGSTWDEEAVFVPGDFNAVTQSVVITRMVATREHLYATADVVDSAGAIVRSFILARNKTGAWCKLKALESDQVKYLGLEYVSGFTTLFWQMNSSNDLIHAEVAESVFELTSTSVLNWLYMRSAWIGGEYSGLDKMVAAVSVTTDPASAPTAIYTINVQLEFNWPAGVVAMDVGRVDKQGIFNLKLCAMNLTPKVVGGYNASTRTVTLSSGDTTDLGSVYGPWVKIGTSVMQVSSVPTSSTFILAGDPEVAPVAGNTVVGSLPLARMFRYYLSTVGSSLRFIIRRVTVKYQDRVKGLRRFTVQAKIHANLLDKRNGRYPLNVDALRERLDEWQQRETPLEMLDPTGRVVQVKIVSANEAQMQDAVDKTEPNSVINISLVEV